MTYKPPSSLGMYWGLAFCLLNLFNESTAGEIKALSGIKGKTVSLSRDGKLVAVGGNHYDGNVFIAVARVVSIESGKQVLEISRPDSLVDSVRISPDGNRLAVTFHSDKMMKLGIWDVSRGKFIGTLSHEHEVDAIDFGPNGKLLASTTRDIARKPVVILWDMQTLRRIRLMHGHTSNIMTVRFSPDGKWVGTGGFDKTLRVWNVKTGKLVHTIAGISSVMRMAFSAKGSLVAYGCLDNTLRIWDLRDRPRQIMIVRRQLVRSVAFHPNGRWVLCGGDSEPAGTTVQVWDVKSQKMVGEHDVSRLPVTSCAVFPDGKKVVSTSHDGVTKIWELPRLKATKK